MANLCPRKDFQQWEQNGYPRHLQLSCDGFLQPWALKEFMSFGEDNRPVITVIGTYELAQSSLRNELMYTEEKHLRKPQILGRHKRILSPVAWICAATNQYLIREELPSNNLKSESDSSLRENPIDLGQHTGIGAPNAVTGSRLSKRRLGYKVDQIHTEEL